MLDEEPLEFLNDALRLPCYTHKQVLIEDDAQHMRQQRGKNKQFCSEAVCVVMKPSVASGNSLETLPNSHALVVIAQFYFVHMR